MKEIIVKSQAEFDALGKSFKTATRIIIRAPADVWIRVQTQIETADVEARESSHVVARENSHVEAWGSSHVEGLQNASVKVQDKTVVIQWLKQSAVAICIETACTVIEKDDSAQVIVCPRVLHDGGSFCDIYRQNKIGEGSITLYKVVQRP